MREELDLKRKLVSRKGKNAIKDDPNKSGNRIEAERGGTRNWFGGDQPIRGITHICSN